MTPPREYPDAPRVGVGAVVLDAGHVLLVRRGAPPSQGKWSIPGGLVQLGEPIEAAVRREIMEECGLELHLLGVCGVIDRVRRDPDGTRDGAGPVRYHYVIVDFAAVPAGGRLEAGGDAAEATWVPIADLQRYDTTEGLADMVRRAERLQVRLQQGGMIG
jgi:ADP-ribose pyrophosphatase YjhB (NUDIX family)